MKKIKTKSDKAKKNKQKLKISGDFNDVIKADLKDNPKAQKISEEKEIKLNNYAFIDGQNFYRQMEDAGWRMDTKKFRVYLKEKYFVTRAYYFIGYVEKNKKMYETLKKHGYEMIYKPTMPKTDGEIKGNCDAELVLQAMIDYQQYDKAIIISSDGDYYCLAKYLRTNDKLGRILVPRRQTCSSLLKRVANQFITEMQSLRGKLELKKV